MDSITRKKLLILTAIEIIDDLGYQGLTIHEIATRENITDAAIYKHFKDKNDLMKNVLVYYNDFFNKIVQSIEYENMTGMQIIETYISQFLELYENHPNMTAILNSYELLRHEQELSKYICDIYKSRIAYLSKLIQRGIDNKEFTGVSDAESLAYIMMGTMMSVTLSWRMQNYSFSLSDKIQSITKHIKALLSVDSENFSPNPLVSSLADISL